MDGPSWTGTSSSSAPDDVRAWAEGRPTSTLGTQAYLTKVFRWTSLSTWGDDGKDLWGGRTIPYVIEAGFSPRGCADIEDGMRAWQPAGITFKKLEDHSCNTQNGQADGKAIVNGSSDLTLPHHVQIRPSDPNAEMCSATIARDDWDGNTASLPAHGGDCAAHEFGHAIGLMHEHQRPDRDDHIHVISENLRDGFSHALDKDDRGDMSLHLPYDISSIMHYGSATFSKDDLKPTMLQKDGAIIPKHFVPTDNDFAGVNALYSKYGL
jgi:hypothetical protein